jgi:hypothetical protein
MDRASFERRSATHVGLSRIPDAVAHGEQFDYSGRLMRLPKW